MKIRTFKDGPQLRILDLNPTELELEVIDLRAMRRQAIEELLASLRKAKAKKTKTKQDLNVDGTKISWGKLSQAKPKPAKISAEDIIAAAGDMLTDAQRELVRAALAPKPRKPRKKKDAAAI